MSSFFNPKKIKEKVMGKIVLAVVGLMFASLCFAGNEDIVKQSNDPQLKSACISFSCEKKIKNLSKRAQHYQKKAAGETNQDLVAIYTKCANAKQKMADGYTKVYENSQKCQTVCASNPEISSVLKGCRTKGKSRTRLSTFAKSLQKCANMCLKNAEQAELDGEKELAQQYNETAAIIQVKCEGINLVIEGKKEFKCARKELKELKTKTVTKE